MIEECLVVEFQVSGDGCPLSMASDRTNETIDARPPQRRSDGNELLLFAAPAAPALERTLDEDERIRYLHASRSSDRTTYRCLSREPCVVHELVDAGFLVESIQYRNGVERYTGAVVGYDVLEGVLEAAGEAVGVTLERVYPLLAEDDDPVGQRWDVTPAQEDALRAAYQAGYFEVPRDATATEVAARLDIGKTAFLERLRRGQAAVFGQMFG